MKNFYLTQLKYTPADQRQTFLDEKVPAKFRDDVKQAWNDAHPSETLD